MQLQQHYCVHWDGILCACPVHIVGLRNWILSASPPPPPPKTEPSMNNKRHQKAVLWSVWSSEILGEQNYSGDYRQSHESFGSSSL